MADVTRKLILALTLGLAMGASAQNMDMSAADRSSTFDAAGKPTRGMTQDAVEASFGTPSDTREPVGDPPITRWEYANFVVFFEYDRVIHAVSK
ncbi:MAG: hypothetical protein QGF87_08685 [Woeseiaceae bacterium]|jgi:hypothetical protein|nr:hypothetical protein [Woeseiaceae bacterium]